MFSYKNVFVAYLSYLTSLYDLTSNILNCIGFEFVLPSFQVCSLTFQPRIHSMMEFLEFEFYSYINKLKMFTFHSASSDMFYVFLFYYFSVFFCQFCLVINFSITATTANDLTSKDFYPRSYPLHFFCPILILEIEPMFPFLMLRAKQGNYWYHL